MSDSRLRPMPPAVTFRAWRVLPNGRSQPLGTIAAADTDAVADRLAARGERGDVFQILTDDAARNVRTVRIIQVKKKSRPGRKWSVDHGKYVEIAAEYPVTVAEFEVDAFQPTEPFDALRDDAVGVDRTLVEGVAK